MNGQERMEKEKGEQNENKMEGEWRRKKEEKEKISSVVVSILLTWQDLE